MKNNEERVNIIKTRCCTNFPIHLYFHDTYQSPKHDEIISANERIIPNETFPPTPLEIIFAFLPETFPPAMNFLRSFDASPPYVASYPRYTNLHARTCVWGRMEGRGRGRCIGRNDGTSNGNRMG